MAKVLFFIAGSIPTAAEANLIAALHVSDVEVRSVLHSSQYGDNLEPADGLAGAIPAAYKTASGNTVVDTALYPLGDCTPGQSGYGLKIFPVNPGGIANSGGTKALYAIRSSFDPATGLATMTDVTTACTWASATTAKGTVGAATGIVTGAAGGAGTSVISATYDPDGGSGSNAIVASTTATFV